MEREKYIILSDAQLVTFARDGDSMACGTPSIVYDCTALPELVSAESGYIIQPHDLETVVEIINKKNTIRAEDCIARALAFEKHKNYQKYIALYERILEGT